jgi:hypothetical protein
MRERQAHHFVFNIQYRVVVSVKSRCNCIL